MVSKNKKKFFLKWLYKNSFLFRKLLFLIVFFGVVNNLLKLLQSFYISFIIKKIFFYEFFNVYTLISCFLIYLLRAVFLYFEKYIGYYLSVLIKRNIRKIVFNYIKLNGPEWVKLKTVGSWNSIFLEQIENFHDFYMLYLPQTYIIIVSFFIIVLIIFLIDWISGLILLVTFPFIPLFIILINSNVFSISNKYFVSLSKLSMYFYDRICGIETICLFFFFSRELNIIKTALSIFHNKTLKILKLVFLNSSVLDFFSSIIIAMISMYYSFVFLEKLKFSYFKVNIFYSCFIIFLIRDFFFMFYNFGKFYHIKDKAISSVYVLMRFLQLKKNIFLKNNFISMKKLDFSFFTNINLVANNLCIYSITGKVILGPLNFSIFSKKRIAIIGPSGSGKSILMNFLLGFFSYTGSFKINDIEFSLICKKFWRSNISWISQNPILPEKTIFKNLKIGCQNLKKSKLLKILKKFYITDFINNFSNGLDSNVGENSCFLSCGQIQRIALARLFLKKSFLFLLDEPLSYLDSYSENLILRSLEKITYLKNTIMITHNLYHIRYYDYVLNILDCL